MSTAVSRKTQSRAKKPAPHSEARKARAPIILIGLIIFVLACVVGVFLPIPDEFVGLLSIGIMLGLIFLKVPVAVAVSCAALLGMWALRDFNLVASTLARVPLSVVESWTLSVIPMFVLMGLLMWRAGLTDKLFTAGKNWLGWLPGGLAVGTNAAGAGFAAVSGSSVGATYALTRMSVPEMLKAGYHPRMAIGAVMVAGLPGQLIPPSIMLVLYAGIAEVPVGPQLMAGVGPGVLVAIIFSIVLVAVAIIRPGFVGGRLALSEPVMSTWREKIKSLLRVRPALP